MHIASSRSTLRLSFAHCLTCPSKLPGFVILPFGSFLVSSERWVFPAPYSISYGPSIVVSKGKEDIRMYQK